MGSAACRDYGEIMNDTVWYLQRPESLLLAAFEQRYRTFHDFFSMAVCVFGIASNLVFIVVLTRKNMISPVNSILTCIAALDTGLMGSYLLWMSNYRMDVYVKRRNGCHRYTYPWAVFSLFHANFSVYSHAASLWLTVLLAFFRWYLIREHRGAISAQDNMRPVNLGIAATLAMVAVVTVPNVMSYSIKNEQDTHIHGNCTVSVVGPSRLYFKHDCALSELNHWLSGIVFKVVPCFFLSVFMGLLLWSMYLAQQRRRRLLSPSKLDRQHQQDRTTSMLILIVFIFWLTELPQGILTILSGYYGMWFQQGVYRSLGDLLDGLSLANSCVNFILYCCMSSQFRKTFKRTFHYKTLPFQATQTDVDRVYTRVRTSPQPSPTAQPRAPKVDNGEIVVEKDTLL